MGIPVLTAQILPVEARLLAIDMKDHIETRGLQSIWGEVEHSITNDGQVRVYEHRITSTELETLKGQIGIWEGGEDRNEATSGEGTGLRSPSEEEWRWIANKANVVEKITFDGVSQLPSRADHTTEPSFPPIGNQGAEGSCVAWAVGYYMKTFQEAKENGWDLSGAQWEGGSSGHPNVEYQSKIISPEFVYHLINRGVDEGASFDVAINLICAVGACSWERMPYNPYDHTSWPSEDAWAEAPLYRGNSSGYEYLLFHTSADIEWLKNWIASDNLALIAVDANQYTKLTNADVWTLNNYVKPTVNHANTVVGYDDNIEYTENGQLCHGAFKVANSWGVGGWEKIADGCYWISYQAMKQRIEECMFFHDRIGYKPELVASFTLDHAKRAECDITIGMGNESSPIQTKRFNDYIDGGDYPSCPNQILIDITEFKDAVPVVCNQSFFLRVFDGDSWTTGTIREFAIEYAQSEETPMRTVNNQYVLLHVRLLPLETKWTHEELVGLDNDFIDRAISMATDSRGYAYIAYEDWYPAVNQSAIFVMCSTDEGSNWTVVATGYDSSHNLSHPSIAIDPYTNDIFVAVERERASDDHDILIFRCINETWTLNPVADILGSDDRFPSITSEYSYGAANRQYLSYEHVNDYNDRDLMLARSTDHGDTWSIQKLHGDWPDYSVHAQASITNAEGNIYISYKWGADYDTPCEIRVDRSTDFGNSWTQLLDVDGLPNGCSFPCIVASHGGNTVMVAFQYAKSASGTDISYSYSSDNGTSWTKGQPLFDSDLESERTPALAVDSGDFTDTGVGGFLYAACRSGEYVNFRRAYYRLLPCWDDLEIASDRWAGKGLAVALLSSHQRSYPCIAWTCGRTRNIYYSKSLQGYNLGYCGLVSESYEDLLLRKAETEGFEYWVGELESGRLSESGFVLDAMFKSVEYRQRWANRMFVALMYTDVFERVPDQGGYDCYVTALDSSTLTRKQMLDIWLNSSEWNERFQNLSNEEFVAKLYHGMLHREPEAEGLNYYAGVLEDGILTKAQLVLIFYYCPEYQTANVAGKLVCQLYLGLLRRVPETEGYTHWVNKLHTDTTKETVVIAFMTSLEYKQIHTWT
jgi:hypothetical protein